MYTSQALDCNFCLISTSIKKPPARSVGTAPYHRFECKTTFGIRLKEGKNKVGNKAIWDSHLLQEFPVNKAVYTASSVACFWAGAVTRLYTLQRVLAVSLLIASSAEKTLLYYFSSFLLERDRPTDGQTDQPTDRPTDQPTC